MSKPRDISSGVLPDDDPSDDMWRQMRPNRRPMMGRQDEISADELAKIRERESRPSTAVKGYWIFARRQQGDYPKMTAGHGKWLVFVPEAEVDRWWEIIARATQDGRLGDASKVATARPSPLQVDPSLRVICVYTYDGMDREDAMRVRDELRTLGVRWRCSYKLDSLTAAGKYAANGAKVSLYRV